jgi:hypothetical protein
MAVLFVARMSCLAYADALDLLKAGLAAFILLMCRTRWMTRTSLREFPPTGDHKKWPGAVVDLYLGATSPETFSVASLSNMDAKVGPECACEVTSYLGIVLLGTTRSE